MATTFDSATLASDRGHDRDTAERVSLVALLRNRPTGMSLQDIVAEVTGTGSARAVWDAATPPDLFDDGSDVLAHAEAGIDSWREHGLGFLTFLDHEYPEQLREVHEMPPVLFHRGALLKNDRAVSVVGSRSASERGLRIACEIARCLVRHDITVVSGLARGIDTAAHSATLDAGGRPVGCLGTGIDKYYPAENRALQDEIAHSGLLLSQFWPGTPPKQQNFPMRNAVMSGYGAATVVVEAGEHSGARIQAKQAIKHGRPVILTDSVVAGNNWARALVGDPGVHVAGSIAEVMSVLEDFVFDHRTVEDLAHQILSVRDGSRS